MKKEVFKSEVIGAFRVICHEIPELAAHLTRDDFKEERMQQSIRIKLLTIKHAIDRVLEDA